MVVTAAGLLLLTQLPVDGTYVANVLPALVLTSLGLGAVFVPLTLVATTNLEDEDPGLASGLFNTSQQIGGALGLAILSTVAAQDGASPPDRTRPVAGARRRLPRAFAGGARSSQSARSSSSLAPPPQDVEAIERAQPAAAKAAG